MYSFRRIKNGGELPESRAEREQMRLNLRKKGGRKRKAEEENKGKSREKGTANDSRNRRQSKDSNCSTIGTLGDRSSLSNVEVAT